MRDEDQRNRNREGEVEQQEESERENSGRYWENMRLEESKDMTEAIYKRIVTFSPYNIFEPPKCSATKTLIKEMTHLVRQFTRNTPQSISIEDFSHTSPPHLSEDT